MAIKYTILAVLTRNLNKGFTLVELIFGLFIFGIIGTLSMTALVNASKDFGSDKKTIDSSQNLSAVLELVGNDIKQAGEQMNDARFPVIVIQPNSDPGAMPGSSKIVIRRALTTAMTLCQPLAATAAATTLVVADTAQIATSQNCDPALPTVPLIPAVIRPRVLREARDYRCKLDDINADYSSITTDFCLATKGTPDLERVRAAMSDSTGNFRIFDYVDDSVVTVGTQFSISIENLSASTPLSAGITYAVGSPIYLIEERTYSLTSSGNLQLLVDNKPAEILLSGMSEFKVAAKLYADTTAKTTDPIDGVATTMPISRRCDPAVAEYICSFKDATYPNDRWKNIQGVKIDLKAKYDATGRDTEAVAIAKNSKDIDKLKATAEFFPRNVLSK
jgi:prepilin-type N-terminal cleavage/methylation domain-containing protein